MLVLTTFLKKKDIKINKVPDTPPNNNAYLRIKNTGDSDALDTCDCVFRGTTSAFTLSTGRKEEEEAITAGMIRLAIL
jgi:hypothetical protein